MIKSYHDALQFLSAKKMAGIVYTLDRMQALMKELYHPETKIAAVHIAGTNGKGSTSAFLSSIFQQANYTVGAFNTPVFGEVKDQITINNIPLSSDNFIAACNYIYEAVGKIESERNETVSEFECMVAMTYSYFAFIQPVDVVVVEAGMGGRLDATNVLPSPLATVITNVGIDHQQYLGNDTVEIAREKAGIIKQGTPIFTACIANTLSEIKRIAEKNNAELFHLGELLLLRTSVENDSIQRVDVEWIRTGKRISLTMQLIGNHQSTNGCLAMLVVNYLSEKNRFHFRKEDVSKGIRDAFLPGRWETIQQKPQIIIDTAHNLEAIETVCENISQIAEDSHVDVLFATMKDKPLEEMVKSLALKRVRMIFSTFPSDRSRSLADYQSLAEEMEGEVQTVEDPKQWVLTWKNKASIRDILIITGSHQFAGEMRSFLLMNKS